MTIGFTYDLRSDYLAEGFSEEETAEFDRESTIDAIGLTLEDLGYHVDRIGHMRNLVERLARGDRWNMVFNICEGMYGMGREAQVPAILDAFSIPYTFSDPLVLSLTLHKGMTKRVIRDVNLPTPGFYMVESLSECESLSLPYPLFVKPNAEGTGKGISSLSKVNDREELMTICRELLERYPSGLLVEEFLPGREFTVGILGTGADSYAIGTMEIRFKKDEAREIYSLQTKSDYLKAVEYVIPEPAISQQCEELALKAWKALGCRDGGRVDLRSDKLGIPNFMEVNPLAGLDKVNSDLPILAYLHGYDFQRIIAEIMHSARKRAGLL
jgi:D-alanine-D-alanine ligase